MTTKQGKRHEAIQTAFRPGAVVALGDDSLFSVGVGRR